MTTNNTKPGAGAPDVPAGEEVFKPQRNSRWIDLLILALIVLVLLGGVGKAFSDSDLFAQSQATGSAEACPTGGCVKPPEELCSDRAVKAIIGADGQRLYYAGDHPSYQGILAMHIERGDRWFCTTEAAEANGFSPAPQP